MATATAQHLATLAGRTVAVSVVAGAYDLSLFVAPNTDFDDLFLATCAETGDLLHVKGWLVSEISDGH